MLKPTNCDHLRSVLLRSVFIVQVVDYGRFCSCFEVAKVSITAVDKYFGILKLYCLEITACLYRLIPVVDWPFNSYCVRLGHGLRVTLR